MNIGRTTRCVLRLTFLVLVYVGLGGATPLYAQNDDCVLPNGRKGDGDDLKCRMGRLLATQQTFLANLKKHTDERCTGPECGRLKKSLDKAEAKRGRAAEAHRRASSKDYEDLTVKGNGKRKNQGGGNSGTSADQTTQAQEDEEPVPDLALGADIADDLDEVIEDIDDANVALAEEQSGGQALSALDTAPSPKFEARYNNALWTERTGKGLAWAVFGTYRAAHLLAEVADASCDQVVVAVGVGGNAKLACWSLFLIAQLTETAYEILQFLDSDIDSAEIEGAYERAGQVYDKVSELQVSSGNSDTQIGALQSDLATHDTGVRGLLTDLMAEVRANQQHLKKVMAVQRQIIRLLLQPDGKRTVDPNVLTCTGDDCPVVLACPGPECASPVK
jgi:hypothetical protein